MHIITNDEGRSHRREMLIDEETEIAHLWVIDFQMRIGTAQVRMAGIGDVYTNRQYRMKGYMRHLYEDTLNYMTAEGYDVSMLFGIPNFYTKFGYATSLPDPYFTIKTRDAEAAGPGGEALISRPIEAGDMPAVIELYNELNAAWTCTIVRAPQTFTEFRKGTDWDRRTESCLWEDGGGRLMGYAVWDRDSTAVKVAEVGARDDRLFATILYALAQQAIEKRCESIEVHAPLGHAFAEYAQRWGATWTIAYPRYGDGMMRIMNQQALFEKLAPELTRRLAASPLASYSGRLVLETNLGITILAREHGQVTAQPGTAHEASAPLPGDVRLELSQDKLAQLIAGYRSARDVLNSAGVSLSGEGFPLLDTLFPKGMPYIWQPDRF